MRIEHGFNEVFPLRRRHLRLATLCGLIKIMMAVALKRERLRRPSLDHTRRRAGFVPRAGAELDSGEQNRGRDSARVARGLASFSGRCWSAGALREKCDGLVTDGAVPLAAVAHQEGDEIRERGEDRTIYDRATVPAPLYKAGLLELVKMERDPRGWRAIERFGDGAGRAAVRTGDHEQPHDAQPRRVRDGGEAI